jgi:hypothetical protein
MEIDKLQTYKQVIDYLDKQKRPRHLLLGNGFSMAYDNKIFSYNALSTFIERTDNELLKKLFETINTKNFEQIMQQLDNFYEIAQIFSTDKLLVDKLRNASSTLKTSLIDAVKELHPEHVFTVPEENSKKCYQFINDYISKEGKVFSTNYDLLLYWVLMRNNSDFAIDGFGRELENSDEFVKEEDLEYSELRWGKYKTDQTIYYLHGALPIFDTGIEIVKEEYDTRHYLLEKIKERMEQKDYPIFVTAGNAKEKLNHIMHNKYLSYCYEDFSNIKGSLITFGFNFGDYDTHIIDAINKAAHFGKKSGDKLFSIYIGVYTDNDLSHIEKIRNKFKFKVTPYNARTAEIWR